VTADSENRRGYVQDAFARRGRTQRSRRQIRRFAPAAPGSREFAAHIQGHVLDRPICKSAGMMHAGKSGRHLDPLEQGLGGYLAPEDGRALDQSVVLQTADLKKLFDGRLEVSIHSFPTCLSKRRFCINA
jgi:hypothetical protein